MNSNFVFRPKLRAVFGEAGRRACKFEAKQFVWVLIMIVPALAVLYGLMLADLRAGGSA